MTLNFTGRKMEISDNTKKHTEEKLLKFNRFFQNDFEVFIKMSKEHEIHIVEITVHYSHMFFRAEEQDENLYSAIDYAIESIERQIIKNKTRLEKKLRQGAFERTIQTDVNNLAEENFDLIRHKVFVLKPMSVDEAILQMNLLNHQFFVFKNIDSNDEVHVVYKRAGKGYGLIDCK